VKAHLNEIADIRNGYQFRSKVKPVDLAGAAFVRRRAGDSD
jgi:hypothetical protein